MYIPLEDGEQILLKVHRHWIFIVLRVFGLAILLLLPAALILVLDSFGIVSFGITSAATILTVWALWGLVCWATFWQFWTTYYMDIWVVTNRRIIDIDYERLFDRQISMLRLDRVQDITTHVTGVFGTLLKYGSVVVQTAGTQDEFVIDQISDPESLRDAINKLVTPARV